MSQFKRVVIVHDWLVGGGAELVVEQLHQMFPDAPIYTSYCTPEWRKRLDNKVVTGWLQHLGRVRKFIPFLRIWWFTHLRLDGYDLVISSSGAEAKGIRVPKGTLHVNYCHAPTHYYWSRYDEYMHRPGFGRFDPLARLGLRLLVGPLRRWDYKAAQRPDVMIANSSHIQAEIKKYYGRDSTIIFPPVDTDRFSRLTKTTGDYYLVTGRQTPYKRFDLAVQACTALGLPLHVVGQGPDHARLQALAGPTVQFLGRLDDGALAAAYAGARALIFPGLDDFGITPVEAMAAGTPVVAYHAGGALDYVRPGTSGAFFAQLTAASLQACLEQFDPSAYSTAAVRQVAAEFSVQNFRTSFQKLLDNVK